jgi:hypothetical protein
MQNFLTTIATGKSKSAELHCFRMNPEKTKSLDQKYFEKQESKLKLLERIYS